MAPNWQNLKESMRRPASEVLSWRRRRGLKARLADRGWILLNFGIDRRRKKMEIVRSAHRDVFVDVSYLEGYQLLSCVEATAHLDGVLVEVGTFYGGTARLICEAKGDRSLHVFDTFEGLPSVDARDHPNFFKGHLKAPKDSAERILAPYPNVHIHEGIFPDSGECIRGSRIAFVHLDVDTYQSTHAALDFLYPRMCPGGLILSHDYEWATGVRQAFDDFFENKTAAVVPLAGGSQCLVCATP